jgi:RNA polymerase sigma factor (sigma-70 family)
MAHVRSGPQASIQYGSSSPSEQGQPSPGFEELAMPLLDSLYNFARWLVRDQSDAEDLVQEAYLKAFRNFTSFRSGTNFRAWMFQILKNAFLSSRAKLDRRMIIAMDLEEDSPVFTATCDSPESRLIECSDINAVRCAIERLPIIFREVVLLRDLEDASYQEISDMLSIPIGTVMSRLCRARKALRELLRSSSSAAFMASGSYRDERCKEDFGTPR